MGNKKKTKETAKQVTNMQTKPKRGHPPKNPVPIEKNNPVSTEELSGWRKKRTKTMQNYVEVHSDEISSASEVRTDLDNQEFRNLLIEIREMVRPLLGKLNSMDTRLGILEGHDLEQRRTGEQLIKTIERQSLDFDKICDFAVKSFKERSHHCVTESNQQGGCCCFLGGQRSI